MNPVILKLIFLISTIISVLGLKAEKLKIVCIGNSISQGKNVYTSGTNFENLKFKGYRTFLWTKLDSAGYDVDFVGYNPYYFNESTNLTNIKYTINVPVSPYTGHAFPRYHECYWGINTINFLGGINSTAGGHPIIPNFETRLGTYDAPDIALIHIGTNADIHQDSIQITSNNIRTIITTLRTRNPHITIFLAKLITNWTKVNTLIPTIATEMSSTMSPIIIVDQTVGFLNDPKDGFTWDWVHPTDKGAMKMADTWYKAFTENYVTSVPIHVSKIAMAYPNPASNFFRISGAEPLKVSMFDLTGKIILSIPNYIPQNTVNIGNFRKGIYLIKIENSNSVDYVKMTVK